MQSPLVKFLVLFGTSYYLNTVVDIFQHWAVIMTDWWWFFCSLAACRQKEVSVRWPERRPAGDSSPWGHSAKGQEEIGSVQETCQSVLELWCLRLQKSRPRELARPNILLYIGIIYLLRSSFKASLRNFLQRHLTRHFFVTRKFFEAAFLPNY